MSIIDALDLRQMTTEQQIAMMQAIESQFPGGPFGQDYSAGAVQGNPDPRVIVPSQIAAQHDLAARAAALNAYASLIEAHNRLHKAQAEFAALKGTGPVPPDPDPDPGPAPDPQPKVNPQ